MDHEDDDDVLQEGAAPAKALVAAQMQEHARVSLYRALKTALHIFYRRGFEPTQVGVEEVAGHKEALRAIAEYKDPARAAEAERIREIVLEGVVPDKPRRYTTAWASGYAPGTKIAVSVISGGNVQIMRSILTHFQTLGIAHALVLHRNELTPPARKFLADDVTGTRTCAVQNMSLYSLQAPIDKSRMSPPHIPMSEAMTAKLAKRFGPPDKFPKLLTTDAMVRFLGLAKGDVVMTLERVGSGAPEHRWYQVVEV
jgi:DNA-directed RNA polymerase subunit H (RpoH/RPB5)